MSRLFRTAILSSTLTLPAVPISAQEADGEVVFNTHCRNCHSMKKDDHRLAPSLHGIFGKPGGVQAGYGGYSGALKGLTWDEATLDKFMENPSAVASNTSMIYPPVADANARKAIIGYLKQSGSE